MQRLRFMLTAFLIGTLSHVVQADDAPLARLHDDAGVVLRIKAPEETIKQTVEMARTMGPFTAQLVSDNAAAIGLLIGNPTMAGADQERDWLAVAYFHKGREPSVVYVIPTTDGEQFADALAEKHTHLTLGDWIVYSEDAEAIKRIEDESPSEDASVATMMSEDAKKLFERGHISAYVNATQMNAVYEDKWGDVADAAAERATGRLGALSMVPGLNPDSALSTGSSAAEDFTKDTESLTAALVVNETGLNLETLAVFRPESATAARFPEHRRSALEVLSQLPAGNLIYFGVSGPLARAAEGAIAAIAASGAPESERPDFSAVRDVDIRSMVGSLGLGDLETGYLRFAGITEANPASVLRDFKQQSAKKLTFESGEQGISQEAEYSANAETVGDHSVDILSIDTEFDANANPFFAQIFGELQDAAYGPDGMQTRLVYWDNKYLQTLGGGAEAMTEALQAVDSGENGLGPHRSDLIADPDFLLLIDLQRLLVKGLEAAAENPNLGLALPPTMFGGTAPQASYIGISLAGANGTLRSKTQLPGPQLQNIIQISLLVRLLNQQQR